MRRLLRRLVGFALGVFCEALTVAALAAATAELALEQLPAIATWAVARLDPTADLEVAWARLRGFHRLEIGGLALRLGGEQEPILAAERATLLFSPRAVAEGRIDEIRLVAPVVTLGAELPTTGAPPGAGSGSASWWIGRLVTHDGRFTAVATDDRPGVTTGVAFDLRDLGSDPALASTLHRIRLHDLRATFARDAPSLVVDRARAELTLGDVLERRRISRVWVEGGTLVVDAAFRERLQGGDGPAVASTEAPWILDVLQLDDVGVRVSDIGEQIPDLTLRLRTTLRDVPLAADALAMARDAQRVELADFTLYSPLDPFREVVRVRSIFVEFSLADVVRQEVASIELVSPTIYVGEDLIWYMNSERAEQRAAPATRPSWVARRVGAELGRIVLTFNGVERLGLPVTFKSTATNVRLADLTTLRLATALEVPRQNYVFPALGLELVDLHGELRFDYPPGRAHENVVNVLQVAEVRWKDYRIHDGWLSFTVDERGMTGELGGDAYGGYVNGGGTVPFAPALWTGWLSASQLDLAQLTSVLPGGVEFTGETSLKGAAGLRDGHLVTANADLTLERPGRLSVPALDDLLSRLPADSPPWRRDLARIAVEALRDYDYDGGGGTLTFADARGYAELSLTGPRGGRRIEAYYYQDAPLVARVEREAE